MSKYHWWQEGIIYQVYPRSFMDSNHDGVGDLAGLTRRLDYLAWLGVNAIWLSPIYPSPMADFGYDVSDYTAVDPLFGTLEDFDQLLATAHQLGLKVLLDFVPNHTSSEHPWFREARASRDNPKRDWYVWRDAAADGGPPNNWLSNFGGSAWEWDAATGQHYYHSYLASQPDLNWRNPDVEQTMHQVLRFWLDRGVDGFRVDALWHLIEDDNYPDEPVNPAWEPDQAPYHRLLHLYTGDQPEVQQVISRMRALIDSYDDRLLIGEIYLPIERLVAYYGEDLQGIHFPFNFLLIQAPWRASEIAANIVEYERLLPPGGWPNWVLGNHDKPRIVSRVGTAQARVAAVLLLTLRGTPTIYYGDELGMPDVPIPAARVRDPWEKNVPGLGLGRDPVRTPMQWDASAHAGFSRSLPWLPVANDYTTCNVAAQREQDDSMLRLYQRLIGLRREHRTLAVGGLSDLAVQGEVLSYRRNDEESLWVALNFSDSGALLKTAAGEILLSTHPRREGDRLDGSFSLAPNEAVVLRLD